MVAFYGELGAGKTALIKAIAAGLDVPSSDVCSPSYTLVNEYQGRIPIYHFDLYRLEGAKDIHDLGYEEYLKGDGISVIEWAGIAPELLTEKRLDIRMEITGDSERRLLLTAYGEKYSSILDELKEYWEGASN